MYSQEKVPPYNGKVAKLTNPPGLLKQCLQGAAPTRFERLHEQRLGPREREVYSV
jgi:hypothetical protein